MEGTVIDAQADIEGTLLGKDAHVLGRFKGQIEVTGRLVLGDGSHVEARIAADAVEIAGEFKGEIKARSLCLLEKARVDGNVEAQTLTIREGARLNGAINAGSAGGRATAPARPAILGT